MTAVVQAAPGWRPLSVLFSVRPFRGHIHPLIPLARAFRRAGHRVAVATGDGMGGLVAGAGLPWFPAGRHPSEMVYLVPDESADYGYDSVKAKVQDLIEICVSQYPPDVIIRDPTDLAPGVVAEIVGAPVVIYGLANFIPLSSWRILEADRTIERLRSDYGLPADPELTCLFKDLYLSVLPPWMDVCRSLPVPAVQQVRYVPWDGERDSWPVLAPPDPGEWPRVMLTLGTVYNDSEIFARYIDALGGEELELVFTLGEGIEPPEIASPVARVLFERYRPHSSILPGCQAVVCHGGFNTFLGALLAGVPLVCTPIASDQEYNANLCERHGFGVKLSGDEATPERIREAVRRVLGDPAFGDRAAAMRDRMLRRPSLQAAVRRVEQLVEEHSTTRDLSLADGREPR